MSSIRATWQAMSTRARILAVAGLVTVVVIAGGAVAIAAGVLAPFSGQLAGPAQEPLVPASTPPALPPEPSPEPTESALPSPSPSPTGGDPILGLDGRFTILLLGSDYRPAHPGNRTDAIIVVSIEPTSGKTAAFSIPRDTVEFPLPGGGVYEPKVNGLYQHLQATTGNGGAAMKRAVAEAFGIEVDWYALIGFPGVRQLVDAIGGVDVTLERAYYDPYYWVTSKKQGWGLPAGTSHLDGTNALIFARSRKGDNDFERARRQQLLVMATVEKVRSLGPRVLPKLLAIAAKTVRTDLPLGEAARLFDVVAAADLDDVERVVFGPRTYAEGRGGSSFALKLDVCRRWIAEHFPPEGDAQASR